MQDLMGKILFGTLLTYAEQALTLGGTLAQNAVERALTVPESTVRDWCRRRGIRDEVAIQEILLALREGADRLSDALILIASRGGVRPD